MKQCPNCGKYNPDEAAFCADCRYDFAEAPPPGQAPYPPQGQAPYPPQYQVVAAPAYAGFWIRFAAYIVDSIILYVALIPLNIIFSVINDNFYFWGTWRTDRGVSVGLTLAFSIIRMLIIWAYFVIMDVQWQATLGKMLLKLKVLGEDMQPISWGKAILRETIGKFLSGLVCALGYIWAGFDDRKQAWHDKIAGTYVLQFE